MRERKEGEEGEEGEEGGGGEEVLRILLVRCAIPKDSAPPSLSHTNLDVTQEHTLPDFHAGDVQLERLWDVGAAAYNFHLQARSRNIQPHTHTHINHRE